MSKKKVHVYSPSNIVAAFSNHVPSGYANDSFISITALSDGVTDDAGADGEVVVNISQDPRFEVKAKFVYGSDTNDFLLKKYRLNKQSPGSGMFSVTIKDLGDNPIFTADTMWVTKPADIAYGAKGGDQEWTLHGVGELTPQS